MEDYETSKRIRCSTMVVCLLIGATGCGAGDESGGEESFGSQSDALLVGGTMIGSYANGKFYFDTGDGVWGAGDVALPSAGTFGQSGDIPLIGYGAGHTCGQAAGTVGVFRPNTGEYFFDMNANYQWDAGDKYGTYASTFVSAGLGVFPFIWTRKVGATCQGLMGVTVGVGLGGTDWAWFVDLDDDGVYDGGAENLSFGVFGGGSQLPAPIWSAAKQSSVMAVFDRTSGRWYVDANNNKQFDGCATDSCSYFGEPADLPLANSGSIHRGVTRIGVSRFIDGNANGVWDGPPTDGQYAWRPFDAWGFIWAG